MSQERMPGPPAAPCARVHLVQQADFEEELLLARERATEARAAISAAAERASELVRFANAAISRGFWDYEAAAARNSYEALLKALDSAVQAAQAIDGTIGRLAS